MWIMNDTDQDDDDEDALETAIHNLDAESQARKAHQFILLLLDG